MSEFHWSGPCLDSTSEKLWNPLLHPPDRVTGKLVQHGKRFQNVFIYNAGVQGHLKAYIMTPAVRFEQVHIRDSPDAKDFSQMTVEKLASLRRQRKLSHELIENHWMCGMSCVTHQPSLTMAPTSWHGQTIRRYKIWWGCDWSSTWNAHDLENRWNHQEFIMDQDFPRSLCTTDYSVSLLGIYDLGSTDFDLESG